MNTKKGGMIMKLKDQKRHIQFEESETMIL
jgi:hypothetical protein